MKKISTLFAVTALAMAVMPIMATQVTAQSLSHSTIVATDHSMRSSKLIGMPVYNGEGKEIGTIADIMVKGDASEPAVVLSLSAGAGGSARMVAVPMSHIVLKNDKATMQAGKTELAAMPSWQFQGLMGGGG